MANRVLVIVVADKTQEEENGTLLSVVSEAVMVSKYKDIETGTKVVRKMTNGTMRAAVVMGDRTDEAVSSLLKALEGNVNAAGWVGQA